MKVSVFGLGYVGAATSACFAKLGHEITGIDVSPDKVELLNSGRSPIVEEQVEELIGDAVQSGQLRATMDSEAAVRDTDVSLICVGTPSKSNGDLDLTYVRRVAQDIGSALANKSSYHLVVLRSTVLPGTSQDVLCTVLEEESGKKVGVEFGVCFNPEFLREGSSVKDFFAPPFTVVGTSDARAVELVRQLYQLIDAEFIVTDLATAEMVKYVNNCFHAAKVVFGNEIGRLCRAMKIDSHRVVEIFLKDTKQNISDAYLRPGYAFGGSCLPKDLRALLYRGKSLDVNTEMLSSLLESNRRQVELGVELVQQAGHRDVGLLGLSFKEGTDDLRESPLVKLAEQLHGQGYRVCIYDENVALGELVGANKEYIERELPHIRAMLTPSLSEVLASCDTIVVGHARPSFRDAIAQLKGKHKIIDLVRIDHESFAESASYEGIGW
ncbi:nucleotide sugar dehydrogenase [Pirellulales bacterium]|nr:nucleotide sugar dehydrogenase [Pirellulales bacterium]